MQGIHCRRYDDVYDHADQVGTDDDRAPLIPWHFHKYFEALHLAPWNEGGPVSEYFNFKKDIVTIADAQLYPSDVVFFDAFAPKKP